MKRACIYARYSTDRQTDSSIEDQVRICRIRADAQVWAVVATHSDSAISGSTHVDARPGGAAMLDDACAGVFDILILEGLDRLSRDQVEQERIVRRLEYRGMRIVGVADGYDSTMSGRKVMRSVRGLINEMYLEDLRHKTHRGQAGQVARGFVAGGKSYGYDLVRGEGGSTYKINEQQADWVRWMFRKFAQGESAQRLAHELNSLGVPSPRGSTWAVSAIYGSPAKGAGILNNELYIGRYVWNRSKWVKDPDTAKRTRIDRPREEWQVAEVPDLRVVDDDTWYAVRSRIGARHAEGAKKRAGGRPPRTLFGGLLMCPHCSGSMVAINATAYGCAARKDRGSTVCQGFSLRREKVDGRLTSVVRDELLAPSAASRFEILFKEAIMRRTAGATDERLRIRGKIEALDQDISRLVDAFTMVGASEAMATKLRQLEREKASAKDMLSLLPTDMAIQMPPVRAIYRRVLLQLGGCLQTDVEQARDILGKVLGKVRLEKTEDGQVWAEMQTGRTLMESDLSLTLVAGTRNLSYLQPMMEMMPPLRIRLI